MISVSSRSLDDALHLEWDGEWRDAAEVYRAASASGDRPTRCRALIRLARCLLETGRQGDIEAAAAALVDALRLVTDLDHSELKGQLRLQQGRLDEHQGRLDRAFDRYTEALELLPSESVDLTEADLALASAELRRGELARALNRLEAMDTASLPPRVLAEWRDELGAVLIARGEHRKAIEELEPALELDEATASPYASVRSRLLLAEAYIRTGRRNNAKHLIDAAIDACNRAGSDTGLSEAYAQLGLWYEDAEQYLSAARYYQESYELDQRGNDTLGQARARRRLARVFRKDGDARRAGELIREARERLSRGDDVEKARLWQEEAELALTGSHPNYERAIELFGRALEVAEADGDERVIAIAKRKLAAAYREDDKLETAEKLLEEARDALERRGDLGELDDLLDDLGEVLLERGHYGRAEQALLRSLELDKTLGRIASKGRSLLLLGRVAREQGNTDQAANYLTEALGVFRDAGHQVGLSDAFHHLGAWHLAEGQVEQAINYLRDGLVLDTRLSDPLGCVRAKRLLGAAYREQGDIDRAREFLYEADRDLGQIDDPVERAFVDLEIGRLDLAGGAFTDAYRRLSAARLGFAETRARAVDVATCERVMALAAAYKGHYVDALELINMAEHVFEEQEDWPELDELYDDLATIHLLSGRPELAQESVEKSIDAGRRANRNLGKGRSLLLLAKIAMAQGELRKAHSHIVEALSVYAAHGHEVGQADAHLALGDWNVDPRNRGRDLDAAVSEYKTARRLEQKHEDRRGVARCHRKLAEVYMERNELQRAEHALEDAQEILEGVDDPREAAPLALVRGRLLAALGLHDEAIEQFESALEIFRRLGQDDERHQTYQLLVSSHYTLGQTSEALECIRQMGQERASIYNVLVRDLHPRIARASYAQFAAGEYKSAVREAFQELEQVIRERADVSGAESGPPRRGDLIPKLKAWLESDADNIPKLNGPKAKDRLREFAQGATEFLYNPAKHDKDVEFTPADAFSALTTAHILVGIIENGTLAWRTAPLLEPGGIAVKG